MDQTERNPGDFPVLFFFVLPSLVIWLSVDVPKGRGAAVRWAAEQRGTAAGAANSGGAKLKVLDPRLPERLFLYWLILSSDSSEALKAGPDDIL